MNKKYAMLSVTDECLNRRVPLMLINDPTRQFICKVKKNYIYM